ncbi:hypothetical protein AJ80_03108 [Polytolypa hystricis UAMH7299]|uniref:DUF2306 domain-containing protein n=1 Tax=Polytolypa hystricis (strain UAMH7299) TaxID=1447883 RepID=A0A2B7YL27_POLH7|nr:hypothetical protein AJ80_03108 [Polytolypa hystricis UAMH7299]
MLRALSTLYPTILSIFGFKKSYNFILFFIFAGGLFGFTLSRLEYLSIGTRYAAGSAPGEWFHQHSGHERIGITLHLACILPCSILVVFQFIPAIRHAAPLFHRVNGYLIMILFLISNAGALMISRHAFGGSLLTQTGTGLLVLLTTFSLALAYYNICRLQIDQHRAWMLRTMVYMGSIVTIRPLMEILTRVIQRLGAAYYVVWSCEKIDFTWRMYQVPVEYLLLAYPSCSNASSSSPAAAQGGGPAVDSVAIVKADMDAPDPAQIGANLQLSFGVALWLAMFMHIAGVEIYLRLTPREGQRLRMVSYERQKRAGFKEPGRAGLVVEKVGDAEPWVPDG